MSIRLRKSSDPKQDKYNVLVPRGEYESVFIRENWKKGENEGYPQDTGYKTDLEYIAELNRDPDFEYFVVPSLPRRREEWANKHVFPKSVLAEIAYLSVKYPELEVGSKGGVQKPVYYVIPKVSVSTRAAADIIAPKAAVGGITLFGNHREVVLSYIPREYIKELEKEGYLTERKLFLPSEVSKELLSDIQRDYERIEEQIETLPKGSKELEDLSQRYINIGSTLDKMLRIEREDPLPVSGTVVPADDGKRVAVRTIAELEEKLSRTKDAFGKTPLDRLMEQHPDAYKEFITSKLPEDPEAALAVLDRIKNSKKLQYKTAKIDRTKRYFIRPHLESKRDQLKPYISRLSSASAVTFW